MASRQELKRDALGTISVIDAAAGRQVERDTARALPGWRWLARCLMRREAAALRRLAGVDGVPDLIACEGSRLVRSYFPGEPMHRAGPPTVAYFVHARRLLRRVHRAGVVHNDLAKEANWLRLPDAGCAIVDFQLAVVSRRKGNSSVCSPARTFVICSSTSATTPRRR
jgi:RIO-like serine/threonine protein kinase